MQEHKLTLLKKGDMKELKTIFDVIGKAKVAPRDRTNLLYMAMAYMLLQGVMHVILAKQIEAIIEQIIRTFGIP